MLAERVAEADVRDLADWQVAALLNAPDAKLGDRRIDVPTRDAREVLFSTGEWGAIVLLARTTPSDQVPRELVAAAITAEDTLRLTETLKTSEGEKISAVEVLLEVLVQAGVVSAETQARLLALARRPMSWAEANGVVVDARAVGIARGGK